MSAMTMKKLKYAIISFYLALFAVLALYDEKPDPGLAVEMKRPEPETVEPGNGWVAVLGFSAREGVSPYSYGAEKLKKLQERLAAVKNVSPYETFDFDSKSELSFKGKLPSFYDKKDSGILAYAAAHQQEISALLQDNRELLTRYEALHSFPRFNDPLDYGYIAPIPKFGPLRNTQRIRLLQLADLATRGDVGGALSGVRKDIEFWRLTARNSRTLISKLIAIAAINTDLRFAAELGSSCPLNKQQLAAVLEILRPFDHDVTSFAGPIRGENRCALKSMELMLWKAMPEWSPDRLLLKQNATSNRIYANVQKFQRIAGLSPQQYADEVKKPEFAATSNPRIGLPFLYNAPGELMAKLGMPTYSSYIEKGHNLEGLRRLSLLQVLSRIDNVPPERMQQFLNSHSAELGNPYTGEPMTWNSGKPGISFKNLKGDSSTDIIF